MKVAKVELYNLFSGGSRNPSNGYLVAIYEDGCRTGHQKRFGEDRDAARKYADDFNFDDSGPGPNVEPEDYEFDD